jgi:hypothetical protein
MRRDIHVPVALLIVGVLMYISFYAIHYSLGPVGIVTTGIGLIFVTLIETALLIGFAFMVAGPLGVSFGGVWTAVLKLAAIVVICDGVLTLIDGMLVKFGGFGLAIIGLPIIVITYYGLFIYLFSMDPSDARTVVAVLSIFYRILRLVLFLLLLNAILSLSGIHKFASATSTANPVTDSVEDAKGRGLLQEAREYSNDRGLYVEAQYVKDWYDAGAKTVWFQVTRDINGHGSAFQIVLEMPDDPKSRTDCLAVIKKYYDATHQFYDPTTLMADNGDPYVIVSMPFK